MKKLILLSICLFAMLNTKGQQFSYEYEYDNAGNRIRCTIIQLNNRDLTNGNDKEAFVEFTDIIPDGTVIKLFPNPTHASVNIELTEDKIIEKYVLTDVSGKIVQKSQHDNQTLTIDLSSKIEGIYLLTILIGETWYSCKIIKQ